MAKLLKEFTKGITVENPTFGLVLGLCPTLAVSTSVVNAIGMGAAATFVLVCSNAIVAAVRGVIPNEIRLPAFILIIATFVSMCEMAMKAYTPALNASLGIFVPLIVVNCIIMARVEAFASKNAVVPSILDGAGMGVGFTIGLSVIAALRELSGSGSIAGLKVVPAFEGVGMMVLAPGALLTLGLLIGLVNVVRKRRGGVCRQRKGGCCG